MDPEIRSVEADLFNSTPKCAYFAYNGQQADSCSAALRNAASEKNRLDSALAEMSPAELAVLVQHNFFLSASEVRSLFDFKVIAPDQRTALKLLNCCCRSDSAEGASAFLAGEFGEIPMVNGFDDFGKSPLHTAASAQASRCVEVLLNNGARTDLRTKDGQAQLPLELSVSEISGDLNCNANDISVEDLVNHMSEKDLSTVRLLSEKTNEVAEMAYTYAVKGRLDSLTALLIAAGEKVIDSVLEFRNSKSGSKEKMTIYECLIRQALALGSPQPYNAAVQGGEPRPCSSYPESEMKKLLLRAIELLHLFGSSTQGSRAHKKKVTSPLIRAAKVGDAAVIRLLLKKKIDVNDADGDGNTALHWILQLPRLLCPEQIKIVWLLLDHGAVVRQRNKLGLTAFHIAAGNNNLEALEVLLLEDPVGVQYMTEMRETPLCFAVKNESRECAKLLLTWGANTEVDLRSRVSTAVDVDSHQRCARRAKCFNVHCEEEFQKVNEFLEEFHLSAAKLLKRKIFVGGLPPSVDSDDLAKFCDVEDAVVIVNQTEKEIQSQGFGLVTFRQEKSASEAMQAHYVTMRGKKIEINGLIPKLVLGAEFEKWPPQLQERERNFLHLQQKSNNIEGDNCEKVSCADRLVPGQQTACSTESQVIKCSENPSTPAWLKVFKKWFPGFLKGLSKNSNYALCSLKVDFMAMFGLKLDHSSVGYSKLSDFLKSEKGFPSLCTIETLPTCKSRTPTHKIIRPVSSRPQCQLLTILRTPKTLLFPSLNVHGGDSKCPLDFSTGNVGGSKCIQNPKIDNGSDTKRLQGLSGYNAVDSKFRHGTTNLAWILETGVLLALIPE